MALDQSPNKLESVWVQRNTENQFYEQINISGSDLIVYHSSSGEIQADKISDFATKYGIGDTSKVSLVDTTAGYLSDKIQAGSNISITILNPGANETMSISSAGGAQADQATLATQSLYSTQSLYATSSLTASYEPFNGNRSITRGPYTGINLGTDSVIGFLDAFFFPFNTASISINSGTSYYETGSSQSVTINGSVTARSETVFGSGSVRRNGIDWYTFSSASSYSTSDTVAASLSYRTYMQVGNNGSPTLINSSLKSAVFIYPYLWGMSTVAGLSGQTLYNAMLTKSITLEATKTATLNGVSTYIYFCFPKSYGSYTYHELSSIKDPNNFEILSSFEYSSSVEVTSSGLAADWNTLYNVYRLTLQANPNGAFIFTHGSIVA